MHRSRKTNKKEFLRPTKSKDFRRSIQVSIIPIRLLVDDEIGKGKILRRKHKKSK